MTFVLDTMRWCMVVSLLAAGACERNLPADASAGETSRAIVVPATVPGDPASRPEVTAPPKIVSREVRPAEASAPAPAAVPGASLTAADELELTTLRSQLEDPTRNFKTKAEAAELLLARSFPQAQAVLAAVLRDAGNPEGQIAVAEAIAHQGMTREIFVEPLLAMLSQKSSGAAAARALAAYKTPAVLDRLVTLATAAAAEKSARLAAIAALQQMLDKKAAATLVALLDDKDDAIRRASLDALGRLTGIRAFGESPRKWQQWWRANRNKEQRQWLADLADNLVQANAALEAQNAQLLEKLSRAMADLYAATPPAAQDALLLKYLKDPMPESRLAGLTLIDRKVASGATEFSREIVQQVPQLLNDNDERVRQVSAMLVSTLGNGQSVGLLLGRLPKESSPAVRQAIVKALGQLRDAKALPAVLDELNSGSEAQAAVAAAALARIAGKGPLEERLRVQAVNALIIRYRMLSPAGESAALREELLGAMGVLRDAAFISVLEEATKHPAATVRLAAVGSLNQMGQASSASLIAPLVADADRGVRQAAIAALGSLGGAKSLPTILPRTNPAVESDAVVRQQAWDVVMDLLTRADADTLLAVSDSLADRSDAVDQRIKILQKLIAILTPAGDAKLSTLERKLAVALLKVGRPAEAAPHFAQAFARMSQAGDPTAGEVWHQWVEALLLADDPAAVKALAGQKDATAYARAAKAYLARLAALETQKNWAALVTLSQGGEEALARCAPDALATLNRCRQTAQEQHARNCRQRVAKLVPQLQAGDEQVRKAAAAELQLMGLAAFKPLCEELRTIAAAQPDHPDAERAILTLLKQIAPKLALYDPAATPKPDRVKIIDGWLAN